MDDDFFLLSSLSGVPCASILKFRSVPFGSSISSLFVSSGVSAIVEKGEPERGVTLLVDDILGSGSGGGETMFG